MYIYTYIYIYIYIKYVIYVYTCSNRLRRSFNGSNRLRIPTVAVGRMQDFFILWWHRVGWISAF